MAAAPLEDPLIGAHAGSYRIDAVLGGGGMGKVYRAEHPELGKQAAVKVLALALAGDTDLVRRFRVEAQAVARLHHPNIIEVLDFGTLADGRPFYTMELLRGESLHQLLRRQGRISVEAMVAILDPVLAALDAAHSAGIVHRDLKPENIFLALEGDSYVPKLLDFGVAKLVDGEWAAKHHTQTGSLLGTPTYMSPEQAAGQSSRIGPPSDLYAIGVMAYELVTGRPPFVAAHIGELIHQHLSMTPPLLRTLRPDAPEDLEALLVMALDKDPGQRPQSAQAMRRALMQIATPSPVTIVEFGAPGGGPQSGPMAIGSGARGRSTAVGSGAGRGSGAGAPVLVDLELVPAGAPTPPTRIQGSTAKTPEAALLPGPSIDATSPSRPKGGLFVPLAIVAALLAGAAIAVVLVRAAAPKGLTASAGVPTLADGGVAADAAEPTVVALGAGGGDAPDAALAPEPVDVAGETEPPRAGGPGKKRPPGAALAVGVPDAGVATRPPPGGVPTGSAGIPPGAEGSQEVWDLLADAQRAAAGQDYPKMLAIAEQALALHPNHAQAAFLAGLAGCMMKNADIAKKYYPMIGDKRLKNALEDQCVYKGIHILPTSADTPAGRSARTLELYPKAIELLIKDPARALAIGEEILRLDPNHEGGYIVLAQCYCRLHRVAEARAAVKKLRPVYHDMIDGVCKASGEQLFPPDAGP